MTSPEPVIPDLDRFARDVEWLRRLARRLIADPGRAEDVAQETWLAALRPKPRTPRVDRHWLAGTLHNLARLGFRQEARRTERERHAARPERLVEAEAQEVVRPGSPTDADVALGRPRRVLARSRGRGPHQPIPERLDVRDEDIEHDIELERGASIQGREVAGDLAAPPAGTRVLAVTLQYAESSLASRERQIGRLADDGDLEVSGLRLRLGPIPANAHPRRARQTAQSALFVDAPGFATHA